jgi:hypothetical protein
MAHRRISHVVGRMGISWRRRQFATLALSVFLAWPDLASAEEKIVEEREVAGWSLMATNNDANSETTCMVSRDDELGPILVVTVSSRVNAVFLVVANLSGKMDVGGFYDVRYSIDDGAPVPVAAKANSQTTISIPIGKTFAALDPLRYGRKIDFKAPGTIALFDLSGSAAAFDALQSCAERYIGRQFSGNPGDSRPAVSGNTSASAEIVAASPEPTASNTSSSESLPKRIKTAPLPLIEAMVVSEVLLKAAHLLGYAEMMDGSRSTAAEGVRWALPNAEVSLVVVAEAPEALTGESLKNLSQLTQKGCPSEARTVQLPGSAPAQLRLRAYCSGYPPILFTMFKRRDGGGYLMSVRGVASQEGIAAAEQYDHQLARTLVGWPNQ